MKPYVVNYLRPDEVELFQRISTAIIALPDDIDKGVLGKDDIGNTVLLSCHILARASSKVFGLTYQDGYFKNTYEHSWLLTEAGSIIDVYPVGLLSGPVLADQGFLSPWIGMYTPRSARHISQKRFSKPWFRRAVRTVTSMLELESTVSPPC